MNFQPAWIDPFIWASPTDQDQLVNGPAVFAVEDFSGTGLPGIAMIVQTAPGGEISLPNPLPAPAPDFLISAGIPTVIAPGGQISFTVKSTPNRGIPRGCRLVLRWITGGFDVQLRAGNSDGRFGAGNTDDRSVKFSHGRIVSVQLDWYGGYSFARTGAWDHDSGGGGCHDCIPTARFRQFSGTARRNRIGNTTGYTDECGSATLQVSSVSFGGANAKDFSIYSNNCGVSVAAFTSCQIVVMFSPTASGARAATLTVNDNATGGLQVVSLNGSGADFVIGSVSSSATVAAGKPATYSLSVGGSGGFSGTVRLSCSGAPTAATCAISPEW